MGRLEVHAAARVCPDCGFEFPEPEKKIKAWPDTESPILSDGSSATWRDVESRYFERHEAKQAGKPPTVRVEYLPRDFTMLREWLCPEHEGYARKKADRFWSKHGGDNPAPSSVDEWLHRQGELMATAKIATKRSSSNGRYFEVVGHETGELQTSGNLAGVLRASLDEEAIPF